MTKSQLQKKFDRWAELSQKHNKIEKDRANQLQTLLDTYERKAEPINADADKKLNGFISELLALEAEIRKTMLDSVNKDGSIDIPQLDNDHALAQVTTDKKREINAEAFFRAVHPARRNDADFFKCLTVLIAPSEKFLDADTMKRLVRFKMSPSVVMQLKATE